jgi:MSHA pilin protein MshA
MNKPAMTAMRNQAQAGFTLIELIVVIVILGILAATALPRFTNLGGSARAASVNAARGALASTVAMVHGQALITPAAANFVLEGQQVNVVNTYPAADAGTAIGAGLTNADYTVTVGPAAATANAPAVVANTILIQPNSAASTPTGLTCNVVYAQTANALVAPVITVNVNNCGQ